MKEFIDKDHFVMDKYYDLLEFETEGKEGEKLKKELLKLINKDPYFFDSYIFLAQLLENEGSQLQSEKLINQAHEKCLELVLDKKGNWPKRIEWGWLENRHILRLLLNKGIKTWSAKRTDEALVIFRRLLKVNPNDNVGAREFLLAIKMGMTFDDFENKFNKGGYYDSDSWEWFSKNSSKFPEEFSEWNELMKENL